MSRLVAGLLTALAVVVLPQYVAAQEGKRPERPRHEARPQQPNPQIKQFERPDPKVVFARLDTNHDGKLSFDEFYVGWQHLCRFLEAQAKAYPMPNPGDMMRHAQGKGKMPAMGAKGGKPQLAKDGQCPCCAKDGKKASPCPCCGAHTADSRQAQAEACGYNGHGAFRDGLLRPGLP